MEHKSARTKYCSRHCRDGPHFRGKYCIVCKGEIILSRSAAYKSEFCCQKCRYLHNNPKFDEDYFAVPNLENSYWAGLIAADGSIIDAKIGQKQLTLALKESDRHQVDHLHSLIGAGKVYKSSQYDKRTSKTYHRVEYKIPSDKICADLASNFNIHPRKSLTHKSPELKGDLALAFIAGYIDGDGSYTYRHKRPQIKIVGTEEFLSWISNVVGIHKIPKLDGSKIHAISFYGNDAINVRDSFRFLGLPLLERKKNRWEELGLNLYLTRPGDSGVHVS